MVQVAGHLIDDFSSEMMVLDHAHWCKIQWGFRCGLIGMQVSALMGDLTLQQSTFTGNNASSADFQDAILGRENVRT